MALSSDEELSEVLRVRQSSSGECRRWAVAWGCLPACGLQIHRARGSEGDQGSSTGPLQLRRLWFSAWLSHRQSGQFTPP